MIAILVAVNQELRPILQRAQANHVVRQAHLDFHEGTLAGQPVAILALGVGKECARIAAELTIRCYRPELIISAGFGGALQPELRHGDVVVGTEALDLGRDHGSQVQCQSRYRLYPGPLQLGAENGFRLHRGPMLTTDDMVLKAATKRHLGLATTALTVDMETSAVAKVATDHGTELLAVRCVTDTVQDDLPAEFNDFFILGQLQFSRVLSACNRHPRVVLDLARLGLRAKRAGEVLARFLAVALRQRQPPVLADH